jgi:glutathione S-transferase
MLKFYYAPLSINARRVWIALLEKQIPFEAIQLNLDGDQFSSEFTQINPLQRVPVLIDDGLTLVESLAILDYLEAKYPTIALTPQDIESSAIGRMICMVALTELQPATIPLTKQLISLSVDPITVKTAQQRIIQILQFFENQIHDRPYLLGNDFTLADIVAGTLVEAMPMLGIAMNSWPQLTTWLDRLASRRSFQQTAPTPEQIQAALPNVKKILETR